jgi:hypothetical protein
MRMLERDREARYPTAQTVVEALLDTSAINARAGLELRQLLSDRFPGQARRRSSPGSPERVTIHASSRSVSPVAHTLPAGPAGMAAARTADPGSPVARSPMRTLTGAPGTPVPSGSTPAALAARRRRPWLAGAMVALVAAGVTGGLLIARARQESGVAAAPDAAAITTPPRATAPRATAPRATPPAPAVATEPAAAPDAGPAAVAKAPPPDAAPVTTAAPDEPAPRRRREDRSAEPGFLDVSVDPWAHVSVDGKEYGQTPKTIPLPPGSHRVVLTNSELRKREQVKVRIKSRQTRSLDRKW